jgi:hypothetical protein
MLAILLPLRRGEGTRQRFVQALQQGDGQLKKLLDERKDRAVALLRLITPEPSTVAEEPAEDEVGRGRE